MRYSLPQIIIIWVFLINLMVNSSSNHQNQHLFEQSTHLHHPNNNYLGGFRYFYTAIQFLFWPNIMPTDYRLTAVANHIDQEYCKIESIPVAVFPYVMFSPHACMSFYDLSSTRLSSFGACFGLTQGIHGSFSQSKQNIDFLCEGSRRRSRQGSLIISPWPCKT